MLMTALDINENPGMVL